MGSSAYGVLDATFVGPYSAGLICTWARSHRPHRWVAQRGTLYCGVHVGLDHMETEGTLRACSHGQRCARSPGPRLVRCISSPPAAAGLVPSLVLLLGIVSRHIG
jgi:hypothetical protein